MTRPLASLLLLPLLLLAAPAQAAEAEACLVNRLPVPATASFHGVSSQEGSVPLGRLLEVAAGRSGCARLPTLRDGRPVGRLEMSVFAPRPQGWNGLACSTGLRPGGTVTVTLEGSPMQPRCRFG